MRGGAKHPKHAMDANGQEVYIVSCIINKHMEPEQRMTELVRNWRRWSHTLDKLRLCIICCIYNIETHVKGLVCAACVICAPYCFVATGAQHLSTVPSMVCVVVNYLSNDLDGW